MYTINRTMFIAMGIAAVSGTAALIAAGWTAADRVRFLARAVEVEGRVTGPYATPDHPYFAYAYPPGTRRTGRSRIESSGYRYLPGDPIALLVDPEEPDRAEIRDFWEQWLVPLVLALLGLAAAVPGFGVIAYAARKSGLKARLLERGIRIKAAIEHVSRNPLVNVNDVSPSVVVASARIEGKVYAFTSDYIWYDPSPYLDRAEVDVYYQEGNPSRYYMDLSFLPGRGN